MGNSGQERFTHRSQGKIANGIAKGERGGVDNPVKEDVEITAVVKQTVVNGNKLIMQGEG